MRLERAKDEWKNNLCMKRRKTASFSGEKLSWRPTDRQTDRPEEIRFGEVELGRDGKEIRGHQIR